MKARIHIPVDSEVIFLGSEDIWAPKVNPLFKDLFETLILSSVGFSIGLAVMVTVRVKLLGMHYVNEKLLRHLNTNACAFQM